MYRDGSSALDEHDRAVGAILIGETMAGQCERAIETIRDPHAPERWRAMRDIYDDYAEIWRQLDRARRELAGRGANTMGYEEMRAQVLPSITLAGSDGEDIDPEALEDARRAIAELKLAVPGADWKAIARRTQHLVDTPRLQRHHRLAVTGVVSAVLLTLASIFVSSIPEPRRDPRAEMRKELAGVAQQRKVKIQYLQLAVGSRTEPRCERELAQEYVKLLVMDGRGNDAEAFAGVYAGRCGADRVVAAWANAPRPR